MPKITISIRELMTCNFCKDEWKLYLLFAHGVITKDEFELGVIPDRELILNDTQMGVDDVDAVWSAYTGVKGDSYLDRDAYWWLMEALPKHNTLWRKYALWCAKQVEHLMTCNVAKECLIKAATMKESDSFHDLLCCCAEKRYLPEETNQADEAGRHTIIENSAHAVAQVAHFACMAVKKEAFDNKNTKVTPPEAVKNMQKIQNIKCKEVFRTGIC